MKVLDFIAQKKDNYKSFRTELKHNFNVANKLGFSTEKIIIDKDISYTREIINLLGDIEVELKKEQVFTEAEISNLQSEVHKITGDGVIMELFNKLLGVNAGSGS